MQLYYLLLFLPLPIMFTLWLRYYNKIILEGIKFPGEKYFERRVTIRPSSSVTLEVGGKCTIIVNGINSWATIRLDGKAKEKVFKIRLLNTADKLSKLEIINESKVFSIDVIVRCSGNVRSPGDAFSSKDKALEENQ